MTDPLAPLPTQPMTQPINQPMTQPPTQPVSRLPALLPDELDAEQRALYDSIASGPRAQGRQLFALTDSDGGLTGPFNAMLLAPQLGTALQAVGGAVRYAGLLTDRCREIAILLVASHWQSDFERYAHEAVGAATGLTQPQLDALRHCEPQQLQDPVEQLVADTVVALLQRSDLTETEFTAARDGLGLPTVFEILTLVGYYATLALQLRVFRVPAPR